MQDSSPASSFKDVTIDLKAIGVKYGSLSSELDGIEDDLDEVIKCRQ